MNETKGKVNIYNNMYTMEFYEIQPGKMLVEWYEVGCDYCIGSIEADSESFIRSLQSMLEQNRSA